jgi:hypothetical protein
MKHCQLQCVPVAATAGPAGPAGPQAAVHNNSTTTCHFGWFTRHWQMLLPQLVRQQCETQQNARHSNLSLFTQ